MRVLIFDPSGNFGEREGQGITGWAFFKGGKLNDFGRIDSSEYDSQEEYWLAHKLLVDELTPDHFVCESYRLFAHKAQQQSGSSLDTPQLIGYLRMKCWEHGTKVHFQSPSDKIRVTDPLLVKQGVFELKGQRHYCLGRQTVIHERDAIRHGIFFHKYGKGKGMLK